MISKQQQQLNNDQLAEQQHKLFQKIGSKGTDKMKLEKNIRDRILPQNIPQIIKSIPQNDDTSVALSKLCRNQAEEIKMLYEQLQQREIDLKDIRYEYITALKMKKNDDENNSNNRESREGRESRDNKENKNNNKHNTPTKINKKNFITDKNNKNLIYSSNNINDSILNPCTTDDDELYFSSSPEVISQSPSPRRYNRGKNPKTCDPTQEENRESQRHNDNDISSIKNGKNEIKDKNDKNENNYFSTSYRQTKNPKKQDQKYEIQENNRNKEKEENEEIDENEEIGEKDDTIKRKNQNNQLIDSFELRDNAIKNYEKLKISYDLLKIENDEKRNIVIDTCGRLIRFVAGL